MNKRVYIAGPMTGIKDFNYPAFHTEAERLRNAGHTPISPAADHNEQPLNPPRLQDIKDHTHYMRIAVAKLITCDHIAFLPGWANSKGARLENEIAQACGITPLEWTLS